MYNYPYSRPGLFEKWSNFTKGFSWGNFLDGAQKTLGVINQAIPIIYQIKPIFKNAKTMFRIANEISRPTDDITPIKKEENSTNKPLFYI